MHLVIGATSSRWIWSFSQSLEIVNEVVIFCPPWLFCCCSCFLEFQLPTSSHFDLFICPQIMSVSVGHWILAQAFSSYTTLVGCAGLNLKAVGGWKPSSGKAFIFSVWVSVSFIFREIRLQSEVTRIVSRNDINEIQLLWRKSVHFF